MSLARHGSGPVATARALASQIHPVFMLPPIASSAFGGLLAVAAGFDVRLGALHAVAVFAGLYTAHVKDGYVDFHERGEDDDHPLTERGCRVAMVGSTVLFFLATATLGLLVDVYAALLCLPGWLIAYHHAPQMDVNPVTATTGYPAGIALALLGGYYVQATALSAVVVAFAVVFLTILSGIKVIDDAQDYEYDRSIDKRTVAVAVGRGRARQVAYGLMASGLVAVAAFAAVAVFPPSSVLAAAAFALVAVTTRRADPELSTMLLIRGSYVFLALLIVAVWFRPLG
jgi:1,4-dihydroxy-2-naphthoate octaprenyltransferase